MVGTLAQRYDLTDTSLGCVVRRFQKTLAFFIEFAYNERILLGYSLMVEQRTLTPHILVRVQVSQPIKSRSLWPVFCCVADAG